MKKWLIGNRLYLIGAAGGAIAGYIYWSYIGCITGTCAITANPVNCTLYFALMGALLFGLFKRQSPASKDSKY